MTRDGIVTDPSGSNVVRFPALRDTIITKKQLAAHLGHSPRWVELRVKEGMPVLPSTDRHGRRRYELSACEQWIAKRPARTPGGQDRLTALEQRVAALEAELARFRADT
ncbi:MAG TPA: hypothetical protein VGY30_10725 [Solirubrobacteraceae bacterium]|jgi:phage terminase Nu1 subunit (DNA packaging protein)|nr:hypothetical protein [Solirubrobacteraceae bacterium]